MCRFTPQQESRLSNCSQACTIIWQFMLNIKRKWTLLIKFGRRLAVCFHCFLPVGVNLSLALYFHAVPGLLGWCKVTFYSITFKKRKYNFLSILYTVSLDVFMSDSFFIQVVTKKKKNLILNSVLKTGREGSKAIMTCAYTSYLCVLPFQTEVNESEIRKIWSSFDNLL